MNQPSLNLSDAQSEFSRIVEVIKARTKQLMQTREGRDEIRKTFGCRIEGFEEEEKNGIPPGMFNSPMQ